MTNSELRTALPRLPDSELWKLAELFMTLDREEDESRPYERKLDLVEGEMKRRESPRHHDRVDPTIVKKIGFWKEV